MCGIAGYVSFSGPSTLPGAFVAYAGRQLQHRGPDGAGRVLQQEKGLAMVAPGQENVSFPDLPWRPNDSWDNVATRPATLALGHNRLSIYDTSPAGHQPMCTPDRQHWIVFNGAIYNFKAIRTELEKAGYSFLTDTDSEVMVAAYQHWGQQCLEHFEGMYAFMIWDRQRQWLWGARDLTGVKPLYWYHDDKGFAFASEQKALWQAPGIQTALRPAGIVANLFTRELDAHPEGLFSGIRALLPGHTITVHLQQGKIETRAFPLPASNTPPLDPIPAIREALQHSIHLRGQADVPVGVAVSGGLDSSIVAGTLHELGHKRLPAFTATFPGFQFDESAYAALMVEHIQGIWHTVTPTATDFWHDLQDLVYTQESPIQSASTYAQYRLMRLVQETGVKVLLDGQGGDELFAGYHIHQWIQGVDYLRQGKWKAFWATIRITGNRWQDLMLCVRQLGKRAVLPHLPRTWQWALLRQANPMMDFLHAEVRQEQLHQLDKLKEPVGDLQDYLHHQYFHGHLSYLLKFEDRNAMRFGIETRVPFADDPRLMELLFALPAAQKLQPGATKALLRKAMGSVLPPAIRDRQDKVGFIAPTNQWLRHQEDWMAAFDYASEVLDTDRIKREKAKFDGMLASDRFTHVLPVLTLALWEQTFFA